MDLQVKTGYEDHPSHNTTYSVCSDSQGLWSSPSSLSHNACVKAGTSDRDFISLPHESHFHPFQNHNQLPQQDFTEPSYNESQTPFTDTTIPWVNSKKGFVEWRICRPLFTSLQPTKSVSLHKRCISFLHCIKSHKSSSLNTNNGGKPGLNANSKVAIRHAVKERKRRDEMKKIFFALRSLLPACPKKSKAKVLLQTIDYVKYLKQRVEHLEKRNSEMDAFLHKNSLHHIVDVD